MLRIIEVQTPAQVGLFRELLIEYGNERGTVSFSTLDSDLRDVAARYAPPGGCMLMGLVDGVPVGCAGLAAVAGHPDAGEMKRVYVRQEQRGKGYGRQLAEAIVARAGQAGYGRVVLSVFDSNLKAVSLKAVSLYHAMGFEWIAPFKDTPYKDLLFMGMELGGAETTDGRRLATEETTVVGRLPSVVFKVSGNDLDDPAFSRRLAELIATQAAAGARPILVHGGGKEITELLGALKIESKFIDGLRVTDGLTRDVALMVMSGLANKRMVAHVLAAGANAIGLSGVDANLLRVARINEALQFVGKPVSVNTALLQGLLAQGLVPVISPVSLDTNNEICNVNADHAAGAIADALGASLLTFITNVPGVLAANKMLLPSMTGAQVEALITDGTIHSGMIPKVRTCLEALAAGVSKVRITDLDGVAANTGTVFSNG